MTFCDNADALDPMFDDLVVVAGRTVAACVFPPERDDPVSGISSDADTLVTNVVVKRVGDRAWNDDARQPKIGDGVSIRGSSYVVASVSLFDENAFTLKCRKS